MKANKTVQNTTEKKAHKSKKGVAGTIGASIILLIAALAFIWVPAMGQAGNKVEPEVYGKYKNQNITNEQNSTFYNTLQSVYQQYVSAGQTITNQNFYVVLNEAFLQTVVRLHALDQVKLSGYVVSEDTVGKEVYEYLAANTADVVNTYASMSEMDKTNLASLIREDLAYNRYYKDLFGTRYGMYGLKTTDAERAFLKEMDANQRTFDVVAFDKTSYPEEETLKFAQNNQDLFVKHTLSAITARSEDVLKSTLAQINKNEILFDDAIRTVSSQQMTDEDGVFQNALAFELKTALTSEEDFNTITSMNAGDISAIIPTSFGYAIFRCDAKATAPDFNDLEIKETVERYIATYEAGLIEDYYIERAKDFASFAIAKSFDEAVAEFGVTTQVAGPFPINYGNSNLLGSVSDYSILSSASSNANFYKTAFSLAENEVSAPLIVGNNVIVLKLRDTEAVAPADDFMYQYYMTYIDQATNNQFVNDSKDVTNNVMDLYFKQLMASYATE